MSDDQPLFRQPYCRRSAEAWDEIERLFRAGATAKALALTYGGTERTIFSRARKHGWLRRDHKARGRKLTPRAAEAKVRKMGMRTDAGPSADAACRRLKPEAALGDAARAAAAAVGSLRDGQVARAQTYARIAGMLKRLERSRR